MNTILTQLASAAAAAVFPGLLFGRLMISVSTSMISDIRESLKQASRSADGFAPLKEMGGYYCSLHDILGREGYLRMFAVDVDGCRAFVYLRI